MSQYQPSAKQLMTTIVVEPLPVVRSEGDFHEFLRHFDHQLEQLDRARTQLEWAKKWHESYDATLQLQIEQADDQLRTVEVHETIKRWKDRVSDPLIQRWAEVLDWQFTLARIEQLARHTTPGR
jgi:hypothetical protein